MATDSDIDRLRRTLRARLKDGGEVALAAADLRLLLDELGRLQQSNDRLRRQNRRVRQKLLRAGLAEEGDAGVGDTGGDPLP